MILSFVIFVAFVIFLYSILQPSIQVKEDKHALLDNLKINLPEKFAADFEVTGLVINITTNNTCVRLDSLLDHLSGSGIVIKDESGNIISQASFYGGDLEILRGSLTDNFFKIYYSPEFLSINSGSFGGCEDIPESDYVVSTSSGREIFESRIKKIKQEYDANYSGLKSELKIPDMSNFGFIFTNRTFEIATENKSVLTSVYAEQIPVLYVNSEANINNGFLTIKVW
jgi:hypothetical protein